MTTTFDVIVVPGLRALPGVWTDREVTALTELPRRLLVLGGGAIGVEMTQAILRMGASVTVVERGDHLLPREARAMGEGVAEALRRDGAELRLGQAPATARRDGDEYVLELAFVATVSRTSRYTRAYDTEPGLLTLVSDGTRLTGAYAMGPEAGEWLQQVTLAIRTQAPLSVLLDVIQPFPTFSEAIFQALRDLDTQVSRAGSAPAGVSALTTTVRASEAS